MAQADPTAKKPGKGGLVVPLAVLTALAGGGGALVGKLIVGRIRPPPPPVAVVVEKPLPYVGETDVKELPPIVTNLGDARKTQVRIQVAIVYTKKAVTSPAILSAQVGDDLVAFLKTLTLSQLEGASGLQNLREDLNERASIRSQGGVREVIIETLVTG